jgi:hypothetical protein
MAEDFPWAAPAEIARLSRKPIGRPLAEAVATRLQAGGSLHETDKEYCGHGLFWTRGRFVLTEVWNGDALIESRYTLWSDREPFVAFLAAQSDYSLAGADPQVPELFTADPFHLNNQRLSRQRLRAFAGLPKPTLLGWLFGRRAG